MWMSRPTKTISIGFDPLEHRTHEKLRTNTVAHDHNVLVSTVAVSNQTLVILTQHNNLRRVRTSLPKKSFRYRGSSLPAGRMPTDECICRIYSKPITFDASQMISK